jgi:hypothetical protein
MNEIRGIRRSIQTLEIGKWWKGSKIGRGKASQVEWEMIKRRRGEMQIILKPNQAKRGTPSRQWLPIG